MWLRAQAFNFFLQVARKKKRTPEMKRDFRDILTKCYYMS